MKRLLAWLWENDLGPTAIFAAIMLPVGFGVWAGASFMEARAYERVTGQRVSTWDAMFLDLRVWSEPKP